MVEQKFYDREPGQHFIGDVRYPNFSLSDYFSDLNIEYKTHESGGHTEYAICCMKCKERGEDRNDKFFRLWINSKSAKFHCYNCGWSGMLLWLLKELSNTTYEKAIKIAMGGSMDPLEHMNMRLYEEQIEPEGVEYGLKEISFPHGYEPLKTGHSYLEQRGIPIEYANANDWGIGTIGFCENRLIVPTYMDNRLVFWQARATWDGNGDSGFKKVLNPSGVSSKGILYGYDNAKNFDEVIITEGFIDAAKVGDNAVATNGKRLHPAQIEKLVEANIKSIIIFWDMDAWKDGRMKNGEKQPSSIKKAIGELKMFFEVKAVIPSDSRDPGDYSWRSDELKEVINGAKIIH